MACFICPISLIVRFTLLQREPEVRVLVAQLYNTLFVSGSHTCARLLSLPVLALASKPRNRRSHSTHACQSKSSTKTSLEPGCLLEQKDVGAHKRTRSSEIDDSGKSDRTLVSTTTVHGYPDDGDGHGEVASTCNEEHTHVPYFRVGWVANFNSKTCCEGKKAHHVEKVAALQPLACVGEDHGEGGADEIHGDGVDLGLNGGVAETFQDGRLEVGEGVCVFCHTDVHEHAADGVSTDINAHSREFIYPAQIFQSLR
jgi:hypothetical protein